MKPKFRFLSSLAAASLLTLAIVSMPGAVRAQAISRTARVGPYTVTLKVLSAESFRGAKAEMVRDSGAEPHYLNGPGQPNHHMVVFITKAGRPVVDARVSIGYRVDSANAIGAWTTLPVVRMHVAGKGRATTHFGNNLHLGPGSYEVDVTVDGKGPAIFHFKLPA